MRLSDFILILFFMVIFPSEVYAYLDLGSGSFVTQLVIAFILGGIYKARNFRNKVLIFIKRIRFGNRHNE